MPTRQTRRRGRTRVLAELLRAPTGELAELRERAARHHLLFALLEPHLEADAAAHVHVAGVEDATLKLVADSAAWAMRIRYAEPALLAALDEEGCHLERIRVTTRPRETPRAAPPRRPPPEMSRRTASLLSSVARGLESTPLGSILLRLAGRADPPQR